jgi:hypothetical protein
MLFFSLQNITKTQHFLIIQKYGKQKSTARHAVLLLGTGNTSQSQYTCISSNPTAMATTVATIPGNINEWLSTHLPIRVVPVLSKFIAATSVG